MIRPRQTPVRRPRHARRGSATVEFAAIAPLYVALMMGVIQAGTHLDQTQKMYAAIRQAGRLASMDYTERLLPGQTGNAKVIEDIQNQLTAEGLPGDQVTVTITHAGGPQDGQTFDLSSATTDLQYFKIRAEVSASIANPGGLLPAGVDQVGASIVFRKGKSVLASP